jgi:hypothetical protein
LTSPLRGGIIHVDDENPRSRARLGRWRQSEA